MKHSEIFLIADSRERIVIPHLSATLLDGAFLCRQIPIGDYLICEKAFSSSDSRILACIERKTLEDFAVSFKDARYQNFYKMKNLRQKTKCRLYLLIEGPPFPAHNAAYAGIPYSHILSAITKLMIRDGFHVIQTKDAKHTAQRISEILQVYEQISGKYPFITTPIEGRQLKCDKAIDAPVLASRPNQISDKEILLKMWGQLPGISNTFSHILAQEFAIADLMFIEAEAKLHKLRTPAGRSLSHKIIQILVELKNERIPDSTHGFPETESFFELGSSILSGINGVTKAFATSLLFQVGGFPQLCRLSVEDFKELSIPSQNKSQKVGKVRANKINHLLHLKLT